MKLSLESSTGETKSKGERGIGTTSKIGSKKPL